MSAPGSGGPGSMEAVPSAMTEAAKGIEDAIGELRGISGDGQASVGRGLVQLAYPLDWSATGDLALSTALVGFFDRWEWGVRSLVQQAADISAKLAATGAEYQQAENSVIDLLKRVVSDATGNPTSDPAAAAGQSWDQLFAATTPDLAPSSMSDVLDHASATWSSTLSDVAANSGPGMITRALDGENPIQGQLDDIAGLAEIAD